jgi:hypothetical protein
MTTKKRDELEKQLEKVNIRVELGSNAVENGLEELPEEVADELMESAVPEMIRLGIQIADMLDTFLSLINSRRATLEPPAPDSPIASWPFKNVEGDSQE